MLAQKEEFETFRSLEVQKVVPNVEHQQTRVRIDEAVKVIN